MSDSREQLLAQAAAELHGAISVDEFLLKVKNQPGYRYRGTRCYRAFKLLEQAARVAPVPVPPPPAPPSGLTLAQSWVFMAESPEKALWYPVYYGIAFTADVGVNEKGEKNYPWPSPTLVKQLKDRGQRVRSWCDCHATFPSAAKAMAHDLGLDGWIGEGESSAAFDVAYEAGATIVVGNLSALRDDRRDVAENGLCWDDPQNPGRSRRHILEAREMFWINELYLNQDESRASREDWMNLPVAGRCVASYDAKGEVPATGKPFPVADYLRLGKFQAHRDSFYDPGATDVDRRLLP